MEWTTLLFVILMLAGVSILTSATALVLYFLKTFIHDFFDLQQRSLSHVVSSVLALVVLVTVFFTLFGILGLLILGWERILRSL